MEKISNTLKRKKRRTRKCLDEIRNRSRRKIIENSFQQSYEPCIMEYQKKIKNPMITAERLTLQTVFPKAVLSETITRPVLAEFKQKNSGHLTDFTFKNKKERNVQINPCDTINNKTKFKNEVPPSDIEGSPPLKRVNCNSNKPELSRKSSSLVLFSPNNSTDRPFNEEVLNETNPVTSITSRSSSQTSQGEYRFETFYEELMNEISSYFRQLTPSIIQEDVIKDTVNKLQKLYVESCQHEYEENILKCINGQMVTSKTNHSNMETMVENPMHHINSSQLQQQRSLGCSLATSSESPSSAEDPALPSASSSASRATPPIPCPAHTLLYGTPEYNYYPHRLNDSN